MRDLIRRILLEETQKDYSKQITDLLEKTVLPRYEGILCSVEVTPPWKRSVLSGQKKYQDYKITATFVGGYGTDRWPRTQFIRREEEEITNEIWGYVYDYLGIPTDLYIKSSEECQYTSKKQEETEGAGAYDAPAFEMEPDHTTFKHEQNEAELTERCWKGYTQKGMKTMFGKRYPNCVKRTK